MSTLVHKLRSLLVPTILVGLALLMWMTTMREFRLDDAFITYRYARNIATGVGPVYNVGEYVMSTTAPLYALVLAALSFVFSDIPTIGNGVSAFSIGVGAALLYIIARQRVGSLSAGVSALLLVIGPPLWLSLGMETALWIALVMLSLIVISRGHYATAGAIMGGAILVRPDAALPAGLVCLMLAYQTLRARSRPAAFKHLLRFLLATVLPVLVFSIGATLIYGSPVPTTLRAKAAQAAIGINGIRPSVSYLQGLGLFFGSLVDQSPFWLGVILVALLGIPLVASHPWALVIVIWGVSHASVYVGLDVAPYRWYYAPLYLTLATLIALGLTQFKSRYLRWITAALILAAPVQSMGQVYRAIHPDTESSRGIVALPTVDWDVYRAVGEWLNTNAAQDATVGVSEVGQIGYYANRRMSDYLGLLQPEVALSIERGDVYQWLPRYAPEYLVLQTFGGSPALFNRNLSGDTWFRASYKQVASFHDNRYPASPVHIYQRRTQLLDWVPVVAQHDFGPLRLVGFATDGNDLPLGKELPIRVRLDWQLISDSPASVLVDLAVVGARGALTQTTEHEVDRWNHELVSTYHTFVLGSDSEPGGYPLWLSVRSTREETPWNSVPIGWLDVSFPKVNKRSVLAVFGDEIALVEADIHLRDQYLVSRVAWYAMHSIDEDLHFFVHVRDVSGAPRAQKDGEPLGGRYPTVLWDADELISDEVEIRLDELTAGQYDVWIGWYRPESGLRLPVNHGSDGYCLGALSISDTLEIEFSDKAICRD